MVQAVAVEEGRHIEVVPEGTSGGSESHSRLAATHYPALDGIRALAFFLVFGMHYLALPWGWAGVDVFFVLSGYLITGILFDSRNHPHRVWNFYMRRTLRIFPLYYGIILVFVLLYPAMHWSLNWKWLVWPAYLGNYARFLKPVDTSSMLHLIADCQPVSLLHPNIQLNGGHLWSLCVEEQFYLVWPWVVFWIADRKKLAYLCAACVVVCPVLRVLCSHMLPGWMVQQEVLYRATPLRVDALLLGGLIALLQRGGYMREMLRTARVGLAGLLAVVALWLCLSPAARHLPVGYVYPAWAFTWGLTFIDVLSACVIVLALQPGSLIFRIFDVGVLRWFGGISYGLYLFHDIPHGPISQLVGRYTSHVEAGTAGVAFVTTVLLAWASYRWFEKPFKDRKARWSR